MAARSNSAMVGRPALLRPNPTRPSTPTDSTPDFFEAQRTLAVDAAKRYDDQIEANRKRADAWGKGVLAVGTALMAALGISKVTDLVPKTASIAQLIAIALLVAAVVAAMIIGIRLSRVSAPIVMRTSLSEMRNARRSFGIRRRELDTIAQVYERFNDLNGVEDLTEYSVVATIIEATMSALADKGKTIDRIQTLGKAERRRLKASITKQLIEDTDKIKVGRDTANNGGIRREFDRDKVIETYVEYAFDHPDLADQKAALVRAEVRYVTTNATAAVVRRRSVDAISDWLSIVMLLAIPVAVLAAVAVTASAGSQSTPDDAEREKACLQLSTALDQRDVALNEYLVAICGKS